MIYAIDRLAFAPVHCDEGLFTPRGCEVTFYTSHDGEIDIMTGSANAEPRDIHTHLPLAAAALAEQFPQYRNALASMLPE